MRTIDIIAAKRDGRELAEKDIRRIVLEYAQGLVPDYQMSAFLMAAYIRGMSFNETWAMTRAMVDSGHVLDLSGVNGIKVDKHSTGGVGDKTTLVVVPILAACGLKVPKMSGRGLGHTGGTLDKLESIPGFNTALDPERFVEQVNRIGAAMAGQSTDIVPADKKVYALRDVTATVDSIPLIAASIMSKKIACSGDLIMLDVKVGSGAFMSDLSKARELTRTMIEIGRREEKKVGAVISDMNQPLGRAVGNAMEVEEAIETLRGDGPSDFRTLCVQLSANILYIAGLYPSVDEGEKLVESTIASGDALEKLREIIAAQDGDPGVVDNPSLLPRASLRIDVRAQVDGYVAQIDCARIGEAASLLGAGRERKEDRIDPTVGIRVAARLGDNLKQGDLIAEIYANDRKKAEQAAGVVRESYTIGAKAEIPPLIYEIIA